ncbi:MAG: aconitate hydratase AcnA [bacterium]|nr:aconitate hydratase AcnA [bacterium]
MSHKNLFGTKTLLDTKSGSVNIFSLPLLEKNEGAEIKRLPFSLRILLEALLRKCDGKTVRKADVKALAGWRGKEISRREIPFMPSRVVLQDFTGVPSLVDLAAMRSAMKRMGGDPKRITPTIPVDLVVDHSIQVDHYGTAESLEFNTEMEFKRNMERYQFLHWGRSAFDNFKVVPPATGIVHQVNLEYLASVVLKKEEEDEITACPDSLVGTDSHTTMINGLGVLGWGVGGIEAEAVMLGRPYYMIIPDVAGVKLRGKLKEGVTATDLVLSITQLLRKQGVVGKFVEFFGTGLSHLPLTDRATIANMAPEYGATASFFPVDDETLKYLRLSGRSEETIDLVERYCKAQLMFRNDLTPDPEYTDVLNFDLSTVEPSLAGPKRPQDRIKVSHMEKAFTSDLSQAFGMKSRREFETVISGKKASLADGSVVIAAITSCTNTSNPSVMIGAGLLAKNAMEKGLTVMPYVKTSLAPGSKVVTGYLQKAGLLKPLETLGFNVVGYGCTTCIGNSGPLSEDVANSIVTNNIVAASVLSGNRNFEGRINPHIKANYLASPMLVVAYALAGRVDIDLFNYPLGQGDDGKPVYLKDVWPAKADIEDLMASSINASIFKKEYSHVFDGNSRWNAIKGAEGDIYDWDPDSSYIREPSFFMDLSIEPGPIKEIKGARVLALLGDSVTTDHISPAGAIPVDSPAGRYLVNLGIEAKDFNSFGSRRGNHEVMIRGTFGNIRLKNQLAGGKEGGYTVHLPEGEPMSIFEAAQIYRTRDVPLIVMAGKEYGTGSSRDWAAKGTNLLGVKAVIAGSFERIHRSNLVGMGVLPLEFKDGEFWSSLGLDGRETYFIEGLDDNIKPGQELTVKAVSDEGDENTFTVELRLDSLVDLEYYKNGGILQTALRAMLNSPELNIPAAS